MASGPRRLNFVTFLLLVSVAAGGYAVWKFFPVYFTAWQVDHLLADGGARAYKISRLQEPARSRNKEDLIADIRGKVVELGVVDPEMTVNLDFVGQERVDVRCDYRAVVVHPYVDRYTIVQMHRTASTSLTRPSWEQ